MTDPVLPPLATLEQINVTPSDRLVYASGRVRAYCGWHIAPSVTSTERLDTNGGGVLFLRTLHLTELLDVTTVGSDNVDVAVDVDTLSWSAIGLVSLPVSRSWPIGFGAVTASYVHGYDVAPPEVVEVVLSMASRMPAQLAGVTQESAGGVSRSYGAPLAGGFSAASGFTIAETNVLARYRIGMRP